MNANDYNNARVRVRAVHVVIIIGDSGGTHYAKHSYCETFMCLFSTIKTISQPQTKK